MALTDALAFEPGARGHDIGLHSPQVLVRLRGGTLRRGADAGALPAALRVRPHDRVPGRAGRTCWRPSPGPPGCTLRGERAVGAPATARPPATFTVRAGTKHNFTLGYAPTYDAAAAGGAGRRPDDRRHRRRLAVLGRRSTTYRGLYAEQVRRSALVVQGMTYRPSGAVVAAVTTSLPEKLGGDRNYDYRYVWVRDFSLTLRALWRGGLPGRGEPAVRLVGPGDGPDRRQAGAHHVRGAGGTGPHRAPPRPARRLPRQPRRW